MTKEGLTFVRCNRGTSRRVYRSDSRVLGMVKKLVECCRREGYLDNKSSSRMKHLTAKRLALRKYLIDSDVKEFEKKVREFPSGKYGLDISFTKISILLFSQSRDWVFLCLSASFIRDLVIAD